VLLVGDTGTGKTTACQLAAAVRGQALHMLNCNQHTEAADFLGGFRPARCAAPLPQPCLCSSLAHLATPKHSSPRSSGSLVGLTCHLDNQRMLHQLIVDRHAVLVEESSIHVSGTS
jgi:hypothetical protein